MEDINPDKDIANTLRSLYDHPDMVELYPGLFLEDAKPAMNPGCGGCPPYTVGRAVFSDAVTLVRSDRFYTLDYTPATLTNWGMQEVQQDYKTLGGSMFYKLIQRAFSGWFPYNSLHVMQPMFTRKKNEEIARELGTIDMYTLDDPAPPRPLNILTSHAIITEVLSNKDAFKVPWLPGLNALFPKQRDFSSFMLGADQQANTDQRELVMKIVYGMDQTSQDGFQKLLLDTVESYATKFLEQETFKYAGDNAPQQIDILRE